MSKLADRKPLAVTESYNNIDISRSNAIFIKSIFTK